MRYAMTFFSVFCSIWTFAQSSKAYSVLLSATVDTAQQHITIHWPIDANASRYLVSRKPVESPTWTTFLGVLPGTASGITDSNLAGNSYYEYKVQKVTPTHSGYGYLIAGHQQSPIFSHGRVLLVIDTTHLPLLTNRIDRYINDLHLEGWLTKTIPVDRNDSVTQVKKAIQRAYLEDPIHTNTVVLMGHVPVPYAGYIAPDGHTNNHYGAWPADVYYGDMDGVWTDAIVNVSNMPTRTNNVPGDGKFDQSIPPSPVELMVGRIDLSNLPAFAEPEEVLLARYLDKNHAYRTGQWTVRNRGLIDDNFGGFNGEAFASNGWRNFAALLGEDSIVSSDYRTTMDTVSFYWSYGCGGGSYTSANGIGNTNQLAGDSLQGVFTMLFGSYFGDWDVQNNFLRAPLAQGNILTNVWAGRPHWVFHHMGIGYPIGYAARLAINNDNTYWTVYGTREIHTALMGDPTLRMWPLAPVTDLTVSRTGQHVALTWSKHDKADTYHIYHWDKQLSSWAELAHTSDTLWMDSCQLYSQQLVYAVRAAHQQPTPGGSFTNLSPMAIDSITIDNAYMDVAFTASVVYDSLFYHDSTAGLSYFEIDFGDGVSDTARKGVHRYYTGGRKVVWITRKTDCELDSTWYLVDITFPVGEASPEWSYIEAQPNPFTTSLQLTATEPWQSIAIYSAMGQLIYTGGPQQSLTIPTGYWANGWYVAIITDEQGRVTTKPIIKQ